MYLIKLIKNWYKGKLIKGKCISNIKNGSFPQSDIPLLEITLDRYEQPLLAKILKYIGQAWLSHWKVLLPTVIAIIFGISTILLTLFIYLDSKSTRETQKKIDNSRSSNVNNN
ncbi:MAG: hypothetical protein ACUZ8N_06675 [Candidatus Scalindua sp.]